MQPIKPLKTLKLRTALLLFVTLSFFASYVAPELLHSALHTISHSEHVTDAHSNHLLAKDSMASKTPDKCQLSGLFNAHTGHSFIPKAQVALNFDIIPGTGPAFYQAEFIEKISHLSIKARAPPREPLI